MDVLGVTPNELLSGEFKNTSHTEQFIMEVIGREEDFNVSLENLPNNDFFCSNEEWQYYMKVKLTEYISNYLNDIKTSLDELFEIKQLVQRQKIERLTKQYKLLHSIDRYGETPTSYAFVAPYDDIKLADLADEDNGQNIPDMLPQNDFDELDYNEYMKEMENASKTYRQSDKGDTDFNDMSLYLNCNH